MLKRLKFGAAIAGFAAAAWFTRAIWAYAASVLLGGALIALLLNPISSALERHMPRPAAILCVWLGIACLLGALALAACAPLAARLQSLGATWADCRSRMSQCLSALRGMRWSASEIAQAADQLAGAFRQLGGGVARVADLCSRAALMAILSVFLLLDKERYALRAELMVPYCWRKAALTVASQIARELTLFLRGQALVGLCVGGLSALGLLCVGVDGALPAGILVGAFNMIPYFGPILGAVPVVLFAWSGGFSAVLLSLAVLIAVQQLDNMWISPGIMSSVTGLSPLAVLMSMALGGAALGILGMLFAIPAAIVVRIVARAAVQYNRSRLPAEGSDRI